MPIDDRVRRARAEGRTPRVVSLVPSLTETLFEIGAGRDVVGITDYCIFPPGLDLPRVGGTKNPRVAEIRALAPDLVYMNLEENLERHARLIEEFAPVHLSEPKSVDDVRRLVTDLGGIHDAVEESEALNARIDTARAAVPRRSFTFACAIWKSPWMWCGGDTYVSSLIEETGGTNVFGSEKRYPSRPIEEVDADVVFLPDEPYLFTEDDAREVRRGRVVGPFPGHLVTWHGSRTLAGLQFLADVVRDWDP